MEPTYKGVEVAALGLNCVADSQTVGHSDIQTVIWVVVKIMVPFWVPIRRPLIFRVPKKGP